MKSNKEKKFLALVERVQGCRKCPRMSTSARVLGPGCGPLDASVMFIGEAPGRLGADGSHLPFHGDKSGNNFESLIEQVGISRYEAFVSNAVLCNPKDKAGNNATPTNEEISNCSVFLREQIEIIDPKCVVTLGAVALRACSVVSPHSLGLKESVRSESNWSGRKLIPLYHPGQRAMIHRSFANQLADYQFVAEVMSRDGKVRKRPRQARNQRSHKVGLVARRILDKKVDGMSYFALHKLYFLAEVDQLDSAGERLTNSYVIRQKDGPYCVDLHISKLPELIPGVLIEKVHGHFKVRLPSQLQFQESDSGTGLSEEEVTSIDRTVDRYGNLSDVELKRVAYLTTPMRKILRKEKDLRVNLFNTAVLPYKKSDARK